MSGTPLMLKPISSTAAETAYGTIMKSFGLETVSTEERVRRLIDMSPDEIVAETPTTTPLVPFIDGDIIPMSTTFKSLKQNTADEIPGHRWCEELMIGDCQHDVSA